MLNAPLWIILVMLAGWINRRRLAIIDYLKDSNRVLREHFELRPELRRKHLRLATCARLRALYTG